MKPWLAFCLALLLVTAPSLQAQEAEDEASEETAEPGLDPLTLQLKWLPQAQFAGYYVAQDQGYYAEYGLDVTILPGGPESEPLAAMRRGEADVVVAWMSDALVEREHGLPLINIAQLFQFSGQTVACSRAAGITTEEDLRGKTISIAMAGNEFAIYVWFNLLGIPMDGSPQGVEVVDRQDRVSDLADGTADCVSAQTYNELASLRAMGFNDDKLTVFNFQELEAATLQDGLYVTEASLADPAMVDKLSRFLKASLKGWRVALRKPESTTDIVMAQIADPAASRDHQRYMLDDVKRLIGPTDDFLGLLTPADYDETVRLLSEAGLLTGQATPAWTHTIWLQAQ